MMMLQWCKTQIMSLLILAYIGLAYIREGTHLNRISRKDNCNPIFDASLIVADVAVLFDGATACMVNLLDVIPRWVNLLAHLGMYLAYEAFVALLFWYWVSVTVGIPKSRWIRAALILPSAAFAAVTIAFLPAIQFLPGRYTNYSMGVSVYASFACVVLYCALTLGVILWKHRYIPRNKRASLATTVVFIVIILTLQILFPEALVTCIAAAMILLSIYLTMENPAIHGLQHYHSEMVMGFATLVENKDGNTGGHIRRSSAYASLIAKNLRRTRRYHNVITQDYLDNLIQSAPMHDIGKIGISDAILQKPGRLTPEEFEQMKQHTTIGGRIIADTFGHLLNVEYESMAHQVALYHHEKWNGKGYPEGLSGTDIPLCARIMAVADVFDAVSTKRCYRDAMSLDACYDIIRSGRGTDFDPDVVDAFFMDQAKVEHIYTKMIDKSSREK
ncbi:MAG: HD-GYP domain-containing protein, partial [Candidatus Spyradocola sp.]